MHFRLKRDVAPQKYMGFGRNQLAVMLTAIARNMKKWATIEQLR